MWGEFYLGAIFQSPYWGNLLSTAFKGFNLITDYSGMGCPEMSFRMIQEALVKMGFVDEAFKLHHAVRALDIKPLCRRVLRAHSDAPTHVMSDIMQRIPVPTREELIALARHAQARLKELEASSGGKVSKDARDMIGEEMIYSACNVLKRVQFSMDQKQWCDTHAAECCLWGDPEDHMAKGISIAVIGNECIDWSTMGSRKGECGMGVIVLLTWCFSILAWKPMAVIQECTVCFKSWILRHVFVDLTGGEYQIQVRKFSPADLGIPVSRPRQWVILTHRPRMKVNVTFDSKEFEALFFRQRTLTGSLYISQLGGVQERAAFKRSLLHSRGLLHGKGYRLHAGSFTWKNAFPLGYRIRLASFEKLYVQHPPGSRRSIADISQTAGFTKRLSECMPTLTRGAIMFDVGTQRPLLPSAQFDCMGIPVHRPPDVYHKCAFRDILPELSHRDMKQLTGNGMHLAACGVCILYVMAMVELVD